MKGTKLNKKIQENGEECTRKDMTAMPQSGTKKREKERKQKRRKSGKIYQKREEKITFINTHRHAQI